MKKIVSFLMLLSVVALGAPDNETNNGTEDYVPPKKTVAQSLQELKETIDNQVQNNRCYDRYKLYSTTNMYNFIKLDTRTGIMHMVQWGLEDGKEGTYTLNEKSLVNEWNDYGCGSFELYPTQNMYQFILLNKVDGRQWHVQWGFKSTERWIRRIY
ncbi:MULTISPECIES: hypothetical protein [unclassified Fibrobacter]|uniref:hypothetical protein n=1 Tax=unclassified Fibrobacter TaxID=2634177 RepID=UPI0025C0ADE5|nr:MULTISPECIES: hypothetical protein [unclassified Fibrobacter]